MRLSFSPLSKRGLKPKLTDANLANTIAVVSSAPRFWHIADGCPVSFKVRYGSTFAELRSPLRNIGYPPLSGPPASGAIAPIFTGDMCQPVRAESARRGHRLLRAGRFLRTTHDGKQMIYEPGNKRVIYILWAYHQTGCR